MGRKICSEPIYIYRRHITELNGTMSNRNFFRFSKAKGFPTGSISIDRRSSIGFRRPEDFSGTKYDFQELFYGQNFL